MQYLRRTAWGPLALPFRHGFMKPSASSPSPPVRGPQPSPAFRKSRPPAPYRCQAGREDDEGRAGARGGAEEPPQLARPAVSWGCAEAAEPAAESGDPGKERGLRVGAFSRLPFEDCCGLLGCPTALQNVAPVAASSQRFPLQWGPGGLSRSASLVGSERKGKAEALLLPPPAGYIVSNPEGEERFGFFLFRFFLFFFFSLLPSSFTGSCLRAKGGGGSGLETRVGRKGGN